MVCFAGDTAPVCAKWPHSPDKGCMKLEHGKKSSEILGNLARILHHAEEQCARSVNRAKEQHIQDRNVESLDKVVGELKALRASMAKIVAPPKQQQGARGGDKTKQQQVANDGDKSKNPIVCKQYLRRHCLFKDKCKYAHPPGQQGSQKSNAGPGRNERAHISEDAKAAYKALEEQLAVVKKESQKAIMQVQTEQAKIIKELETQLKATASSGAARGSQTFSSVGKKAGAVPDVGGEEDDRQAAMNDMLKISEEALVSVSGPHHARLGPGGAEFGFMAFASGTADCSVAFSMHMWCIVDQLAIARCQLHHQALFCFSSEFEMETVATFFRLMQDSDDNGCRAYGCVQGYMDIIGNDVLQMPQHRLLPAREFRMLLTAFDRILKSMMLM
jgi:hypothetical protein